MPGLHWAGYRACPLKAHDRCSEEAHSEWGLRNPGMIAFVCQRLFYMFDTRVDAFCPYKNLVSWELLQPPLFSR